MMPAPIALMAYARPHHLARTITALKDDPLFASSPLSVFVDGPRSDADRQAVEEVRTIVRSQLPAAEHRFQTANRGLAASVIAAVDELLDRYGRVIVVEDDLLVSPDFLLFMNEGLDRYANEQQVMQVSGFLPPLSRPLERAVFLPQTVSWGWATWKRAWANFEEVPVGHERLRTDRAFGHRFNRQGSYNYRLMLDRQLAGKIDSWAIRFYWSVFKRSGLVLYPPETLVANAGMDGSGTHGTSGIVAAAVEPPAPLGAFEWPLCVSVDAQAESVVNKAYRNAFTTPASRLKVRLAQMIGR